MPKVRWQTSIFELAEARGWSQSELARRLEVDWSTLWRWKRGEQAPSSDAQERAARVFKRSRDRLFWQEAQEDEEVPV